jgi:16S rRNA (adenine1518-N6/adenine1519-N6)-dimethyltransferase
MLTQIDLLKKYGIIVRGHVGQHLLIDPNLQRKTVELLDIQPGDHILEIGPGLGALTRHIVGHCAQFVAVEKDPKFVEVLKKELPEFSDKRNKLVHSDILEFNFKDLPASKTKWKVISNIPYYITAPILFHLIESREIFSKMVFTMQREVADRLLASPGSKDYGRMTIALRYASMIRHAFDIPPSCFTPQPAVASSVIVVELNSESGLLEPVQEKQLFHLVKVAFSQRRKMFISLLAADKETGKTREALLEAFKACNIAPTVRGEELLLKDYIRLSQELGPSNKSKKR